MIKWLKRVFATVGILLVALVIAIVALPFVIDPNDFKDDMERLAAKQGIHLTLGGPISWQFFPSLGLSVSDVSVAPLSDTEQNLAHVQSLTAAVAVMPLLKKQIRVDKVQVDGANIQLIVDAEGRGNWEALSTTETSPVPPTDPSTTASHLDLNVAQIRLSDAEFVYDDRQSNQRSIVRNVDLTISDANTEQRPFPLTLALTAENPVLVKPVHITLNSQLAVNPTLDQFTISDGALRLPDAGIDVEVTTTAAMTDTPRFEGQINADINALQKLFAVLGLDKPVTADPGVLSRLSLNLRFNGNDKSLSMPNLSLTLDDTTLQGDAVINFPNDNTNLALTLNLRGNHLNVDRYLAPEAEDTGTETTAPATDSPLPLDALRSTDAALTFQFEQVIVNNLPVTQLDLAVGGKNGLWQLQKFNANFYQGKLATTGQLDARGNQANVNLSADLTSVALQPLLVDLAEVDVLRGTLSANVAANTRAATTQALMDNLAAAAGFNGDSLVIDGLNVEQQYCEIVSQVDTESENVTGQWPQQTTVNALNGRIALDDSIITLEQFTAQVAYLALGVNGKLNIKQQDYEIRLPLTLTRNKTSENGCLVASDFLIGRQINVLGCDGNLAELAPAKQCGLRAGAIRELAQQALRYNAEKRIAKEVTPKVDEKKAELEEKKDEVKEKVRDRLKELLNR